MHYCSQHNVDEPKEFPKVLRFLPPEAGEHLKKSAKTIEYGTSVGRVGTEYSDGWGKRRHERYMVVSIWERSCKTAWKILHLVISAQLTMTEWERY